MDKLALKQKHNIKITLEILITPASAHDLQTLKKHFHLRDLQLSSLKAFLRMQLKNQS
ncbi:hypothetical protein Q1J52_22100 [Pseudomonas lijiangensis]|uniref:hypothetical protein n=1 Tax=Pseudomonas lijiangensis TaxID=2995658 RepID=UPI0034D952D5